MNIQWDADKYTDQFSFVHQYGSALIDMVEGEKLSVLDLGCGNGALTKELADMGHDVTGMDASEELLKIAEKKYPDIRFIHGDATDFHRIKQAKMILLSPALCYNFWERI